MSRLIRFILPAMLLLLVLALVGVKIAYAQDGTPEPPGIDQLVESLMAAGGTWLAAYLVNWLRAKFNIIPGGWFVGLVVPLLGLAVSWLVNQLNNEGNSWLISFACTFGAVWLSQVQGQFNTKVGPAQYVIGKKKE